MIARSGAWCRVIWSSAHDFVLSNGSKAKASLTFGGRSYTGTGVCSQGIAVQLITTC